LHFHDHDLECYHQHQKYHLYDYLDWTKAEEDQQEGLLLCLKVLQAGEAKAEILAVPQVEETGHAAFWGVAAGTVLVQLEAGLEHFVARWVFAGKLLKERSETVAVIVAGRVDAEIGVDTVHMQVVGVGVRLQEVALALGADAGDDGPRRR
jgi:hypothetical protein